MRRLLLVLGLLLVGAAAWAQDQLPVPVQVCPTNASTCAFQNNVVSGNTIILAAHSEGVLTTPTDTLSTTWTLVDSDTSQGAFAYVWIGVPSSSGAETITFTGSLSFFGSISSEWPASIGSTLDVHAHGGYSGTPATVTTSSITTTKNGGFVFAYMSGFNSGSRLFAQKPTLVVASQNGSDSSGAGYRFAGTNGSYSATFANDNSKGGYVIFALKPSAISIVTAALPSGATSKSYSYTMQAWGGVGAYTWSLSSGALPSGLSITSVGVITGTPTGGTTTPTFQVTDGTNTTTAALTLTINSSANTIALVSSTSVASLSSASLGTVTSGTTILVAEYLTNNVKIYPPTDTLSTVFKYAGTQCTTVGQLMCFALFGGTAASTGTDTVTGAAAVAAVQFSNAQLLFDVADNTLGNNAGSVTLSGPSLTTLAPGSEMWAAVQGWSSGTTWTAGTGFTADAVSTGSAPMQGEDANESTTGSYTPQFSQTGNADGHWVIWAVALRPSHTGVVASSVRHRSQVF